MYRSLTESSPLGEESEKLIHPSAEIHPTACLGEGTRVWNGVQIREGVRVGSRCVLGKDVYLDRGVQVGNGVKIQNGVSVYRGVTLEDDVFIGPNTVFTNDLRPRSFSEDWEVKATSLRCGVSLGANVTILCGVTLGQYSMIGAGAVVTEDTLPFGLYVGSPARLKGFVSRQGRPLTLTHSEARESVYECAVTGERLKIRFEVETP